MLPLLPDHQTISIRARTPAGIAMPGQTISLALNGWQSKPQPLTANWDTYRFTPPAGVIRPGLNNVILHFGLMADVPPLQAGDPPLDITVISAGEEVGGFAQIYLNGHAVSPNRRGYNVVIVPLNGPVQTATFDTHLDAAASSALETFLQSAPPEVVIALVVADEASLNLSEPASQTIQQQTGASSDGRNCFRCSHAIIGGKLRQPPLEALSQLRPVGLTTNLGLTEPTISATIDQIMVE